MPRRATVHVTEKSCPKCREVKALTAFGVRRRSASGRKSWCRACESTRQVERLRERVAQGHCRQCGKQPMASGHVLCVDCLAEGALKRATRRRDHLCAACGHAAADGRSRCARCSANARVFQLVKRRGVTTGEYAAMLDKQGERCAICKESCRTGRRLAVDHDHVTGRVRGLLCFRCNTSLARYEEHMAEFAAYLRGVNIEAATP